MVKSLHTPTYKVFRQVLADTRARLGMTQIELAMRLGKPQSFVSKFEKGERRLDVLEFISICDALGVEPTTLFKTVVGALSEYEASDPDCQPTLE